MVLKAGKFKIKIKVLSDLMPSEVYSWLACDCLLSVPPHVRNEKYRQTLGVSSFKGTAPMVMFDLYNLTQT